MADEVARDDPHEDAASDAVKNNETIGMRSQGVPTTVKQPEEDRLNPTKREEDITDNNGEKTEVIQDGSKSKEEEEDWDLKVKVSIANPDVEGGEEHVEVSVNNYDQAETQILFKVSPHTHSAPPTLPATTLTPPTLLQLRRAQEPADLQEANRVKVGDLLRRQC